MDFQIVSKVFQNIVQENGMLLKHIPHDMQTVDICVSAINNYPESLEYVRPDLQTEEMCRTAVMLNPHVIEYIRRYIQTSFMCMVSLLNCKDISEHIRPKFRNISNYVVNMVEMGEYLIPYDQSIHTDVHNNVVEMIKKEIEYKLNRGKIENGFSETPSYLIEYMIKYYIREINDAASSFIRDYSVTSDWIREHCIVKYASMTLVLKDYEINLYDFIKIV